ncbi:MAG: flagellar biosynthetic protein FliO [Planctomycetaceae bacterium]|nr:flagellar biosynthetic protein FliO [Planctomycetaceae bacterium]
MQVTSTEAGYESFRRRQAPGLPLDRDSAREPFRELCQCVFCTGLRFATVSAACLLVLCNDASQVFATPESGLYQLTELSSPESNPVQNHPAGEATLQNPADRTLAPPSIPRTQLTPTDLFAAPPAVTKWPTGQRQPASNPPVSDQPASNRGNHLRRTSDSSAQEPLSEAAPFLDLRAESADASSPQVPFSKSPGEEAINSGSVFPKSRFITTVIWLIVLLCILILSVIGMRKWQQSRGLLPVSNGQSRVLQTLSLGPGRTISLIEMDGLRALVGSDSGGIRTIVLTPPSFEETVVQADLHTDDQYSINTRMEA